MSLHEGFSRKSLGTTDRKEADSLGRALLAALLRGENVAASGALMLGRSVGEVQEGCCDISRQPRENAA